MPACGTDTRGGHSIVAAQGDLRSGVCTDSGEAWTKLARFLRFARIHQRGKLSHGEVRPGTSVRWGIGRYSRRCAALCGKRDPLLSFGGVLTCARSTCIPEDQQLLEGVIDATVMAGPILAERPP